MQSDGSYSQLQSKDKESGVQELLIKLANERFDEANLSRTAKNGGKKKAGSAKKAR